ncbi:putative Late nodulin [Medicago truncatula]|uniref:Nodule Cysteine-Rich (NCR) secreted peptide n=1 Tax=Medicago truncatula TaxID=3880 RepID=A0A072V6P6_MEDTR|nr:Nodule Cysteine-Rich (NCR) secreted peptide [Medicago truncatula]RHN73829.1 putative Late nodulin [Medicago truncatula]
MAKILKFVYATILIIFLFVIATEVNAFRNPCKSDSDCTKLKLKCDRHTILTCFWRHCYCIF